MNKKIFLLLSLNFMLNSSAQQVINNSINDVEHVLATSRFLENNESRFKDAKGSPYITDNFISAKIIPGSKDYWVRYNAYEDEMEVRINGEKTIVLNNSKGNYKIIFTTSSDSYVALKEKGKKYRGYFIEVYKTNNISLYKKLEKKYTPKRESLNTYDKDKPAYFSKEKVSYFFQISNNDLQELPSKQKALLNLFPNNKDKIKNFIKMNRIKLSRENDLIQLIGFIDNTYSSFSKTQH